MDRSKCVKYLRLAMIESARLSTEYTTLPLKDGVGRVIVVLSLSSPIRVSFDLHHRDKW